MAQLDERFLTVHPRTALWWEQREKCAQCQHQRSNPETGASGGGVLCTVKAGRSPTGFLPCIAAREEGHACGPDARLFQAKQLEAA